MSSDPKLLTDGKPKTGRPTAYTPEIGGKILELVAQGNYVETAAAVVGVVKSTIYLWLKKGARDRRKKIESDLAIFSEMMDQARAEAEARDVKIVVDASRTSWQAAAWRLERIYPERWGRRTLELTGAKGGPIRMKSEDDESILAALRRLQAPKEPEQQTEPATEPDEPSEH